MNKNHKTIIITIAIMLLTSGIVFSQSQFQVQLACDEDVYYAGNRAVISLALQNTGSAKTVDLYIAAIDPVGSAFFYTYNDYFFWKEYERIYTRI
jgi:hypothetical protein